MFKITGEGHPPPKVWGKWGEVDGEDTLLDERIATANVILKAPRTEMVRLDLVMDMHKCFNVDDDVSKAQFRQDVTVGSYQFYAQYRCFLPHQEIAKAMSHMVETFNTEHMRSLHPIVQAFYLYSAVVYYIHPYEDGNGRMARLLSNLILKKYGFEFALDYTDKVLSFKEYVPLPPSHRARVGQLT
jgi:Fic family protein